MAHCTTLKNYEVKHNGKDAGMMWRL